MNASALLPVLVQVALTFALLFWMGLWRVWLLRTRKVKVSAIALGQSGYPDGVAKIARAFHNQLEMPILFYACVALAAAMGAITHGFVAAEWIFAALRVAHAAVHVTSNFVPLRFLVFSAGVAALLVLWAMLAIAALG